MDALLTNSVQTFGVAVSYQRPPADAFTIQAIFGHPNQEDAAIYGQGITLDLRVADFAGTAADPEPDKGDIVTFTNGDAYTVYLVQIDSEGAAKLYLQKQ